MFPSARRSARPLVTLTVATAALLIPHSSNAQTDPSGAPITLREIVVTGTPVSQQRFTTPADVDVVDGETKARIQRPNLGATLDRLPGVRFFEAGAQVGKPVIRGFSSNRIRVLSNDISLDFQQFGIRHPPNIDPFLADRIEVVRGPSSLLYGSDAIGGAVNVIHASPTRPEARGLEHRLLAEYSSAYSMRTYAVSTRAANETFGVDARLLHRDSGGLRTPDAPTALETGDPSDPLATGNVPFTGFEQLNGVLAGGMRGAWGDVSLRYEAYRNEHDFLVPDPPPPDGAPLQAGGVGQDLENDLLQLGGRFDLGSGVQLKPTLTWVRNVRISNPGPPEPLSREFLTEARVVDIERDNTTLRVVLDHDERFTGTSGQLGLEVLDVEQESKGPATITPGGEIRNFAAFGYETWATGPWTVNAGLRYDRRTVEAQLERTRNPENLGELTGQLEQDHSAITGGLGVSYQFSSRLVAAANLSTGFRAPTLFDLFANGVHGGVQAFQQGEPDLDEETAVNLDASIRWQSERFSVDATVYRYRVTDYIYLASTGETDPGSGLAIFRAAQDDADLWGGDLTVSVEPRPGLRLQAVYEAVRGELDEADIDVPLLPADNLLLEAIVERDRLGPLTDTYLSLGMRWADDQTVSGPQEPFAQFDAPPPPFGTGSTDSWSVVDAAAGGRLGAAMLRLQVNNLLNERYRAYEDTYKIVTLAPGRDVRLTVELAL